MGFDNVLQKALPKYKVKKPKELKSTAFFLGLNIPATNTLTEPSQQNRDADREDTGIKHSHPSVTFPPHSAAIT